MLLHTQKVNWIEGNNQTDIKVHNRFPQCRNIEVVSNTKVDVIYVIICANQFGSHVTISYFFVNHFITIVFSVDKDDSNCHSSKTTKKNASIYFIN